MRSVFSRFRRRPGRVVPAALVLVCLAALSTSTYAGRGFFTFPLDGTANVWPQGTVPTALTVPALQAISLVQQDIFRQQGIDALDVKHLKLRQAGLLMESPSAAPDFSFLQTFVLLASADGLPDVQVATGQALAAGTNYVGLNVDDVELLAYARKKNFAIHGRVDAATAPNADTLVRLVLDLEAYVAQPGAACWQR